MSLLRITFVVISMCLLGTAAGLDNISVSYSMATVNPNPSVPSTHQSESILRSVSASSLVSDGHELVTTNGNSSTWLTATGTVTPAYKTLDQTQVPISSSGPASEQVGCCSSGGRVGSSTGHVTALSTLQSSLPAQTDTAHMPSVSPTQHAVGSNTYDGDTTMARGTAAHTSVSSSTQHMVGSSGADIVSPSPSPTTTATDGTVLFIASASAAAGAVMLVCFISVTILVAVCMKRKKRKHSDKYMSKEQSVEETNSTTKFAQSDIGRDTELKPQNTTSTASGLGESKPFANTFPRPGPKQKDQMVANIYQSPRKSNPESLRMATMSQGNAAANETPQQLLRENCAEGIYQIPRSLTTECVSVNGALWDIYQQPRRSEPGNISCSFTAGASVLTNESIYQVPRSQTSSFICATADHDIYQRPRQIASIGDGDSTCNADDEIYRIPNSLPATGPLEQTESLYQVPSSRPVSAGAGDAIYQVPRHTSFSESAAGTVQDPIEMSKTIDLQNVGDAEKSATTELTEGITVRPAVAPKAKPAVKARVKPTVKEKAKPAVAPKVKPAVKVRVKPTVKEKVKPAVTPKVKLAVKARAKSVAAERAMPAAEAKLKPTVAPKPKKSGSVSQSRNTSVAASETILGDNVEQLAIGKSKKNSIAQKQDTDNQ